MTTVHRCHYSCPSHRISLLTHLSLLLPLLISCHEFILITSIVKDLASPLLKAFLWLPSCADPNPETLQDLYDLSHLNPCPLGPHLTQSFEYVTPATLTCLLLLEKNKHALASEHLHFLILEHTPLC